MFKKTLTATVAALVLTGATFTITQSAQAAFGKVVADIAVSLRPELRLY